MNINLKPDPLPGPRAPREGYEPPPPTKASAESWADHKRAETEPQLVITREEPVIPSQITSEGPEMTRTIPARIGHLRNLFFWLAFGFLVSYCLSDFNSFVVGEMNIGKVIFTPSMTKLYTMTYFVIYIVGISLVVIRLVSKVLFDFFRADQRKGADLETTFSNLPDTQKLWFFAFFLFAVCCLCAVVLLANPLGESVSAGR